MAKQFLLLIVSTVLFHVGAPSATRAEGVRVFLLDANQLKIARERVESGDRTYATAVKQLKRDAERALTAGPYSVVNKELMPPSGDKHDYMSQAPYWWPNPKTKSGLPYIRRDGERNPEIYKVRNRLDLGEMSDAVETLAVGYFFTGDEQYASRAAKLLRAWFLDAATRMNPHLKFGQGIPGINTGRGIGLIETRTLARVVDSIGLLEESDAWATADQGGMERWFGEFLEWMLDSNYGRDEAAAQNNHGTYYDVQVVSFALFLNKKDLATKVLNEVGEKRIAVQVEPNGRQPLELARTKAWSYSVGNLAGLMALARLGEHADVDLWNYESSDGASIRSALDFLAPFGIGEQKWPYQQINGFSPDMFYPLLRVAATKYPRTNYESLLLRIPPLDPASRANLVLSPLESIARLHVR